MDANKLIVEVQRQNKQNWKNSDIHEEGEDLLRRIAEHFLICEECANAFDLQGYPKNLTLQDFADEYLSNTKLWDWICD